MDEKQRRQTLKKIAKIKRKIRQGDLTEAEKEDLVVKFMAPLDSIPDLLDKHYGEDND
jgi:hypothetical protein